MKNFGGNFGVNNYMIKELKNWEKATEELKDKFVKKYFGEASDVFWIADIIGGTLLVNDYFFNIDRLVEAFRINCPVELFFEYYDYELEIITKNKKVDINFINYIKLHK